MSNIINLALETWSGWLSFGESLTALCYVTLVTVKMSFTCQTILRARWHTAAPWFFQCNCKSQDSFFLIVWSFEKITKPDNVSLISWSVLNVTGFIINQIYCALHTREGIAEEYIYIVHFTQMGKMFWPTPSSTAVTAGAPPPPLLWMHQWWSRHTHFSSAWEFRW